MIGRLFMASLLAMTATNAGPLPLIAVDAPPPSLPPPEPKPEPRRPGQPLPAADQAAIARAHERRERIKARNLANKERGA